MAFLHEMWFLLVYLHRTQLLEVIFEPCLCHCALVKTIEGAEANHLIREWQHDGLLVDLLADQEY